ncbi:unnamed protein product [Allacma fusca]|uniref:EamA domain-containing protein n=1 Tax=Allacma fusca TaxID=39272 RepID=A0A8J2J6F3_9HEXA|nr:unnamed protein product [Allacma fusca]
MTIEDSLTGSGEETPLIRSGGRNFHSNTYVHVLLPDELGKREKLTGLEVPFKPVHKPHREVAQREKRRCQRFWGIILAVLASTFLSLTTLIAKLLIGYHPFNVAIWRFQGILLPSLPVLVFSTCVRNEPVFDTIRPLTQPDKLKTSLFLFLRAFFGCTAVIMQFYALQYIEIGDATVISFTTPVFVGLLSHFMLREKFGVVPIFTALLTVLGIGVITRPPILSGAAEFDTNNLIGAGMALGCMFFATFTYVILRWLRNVHYGLVTFCYGFYSVIECSICALIIGVLEFPHTGMDWFLACTLAALAFAGQSFFTQALKYEEAGPVSLIRTSEVIFTFLWQMIFLNQLPDIFSIVGALTIIFGVVVTTVRKWIIELPEEHNLRVKFWFLLK